MNLDSVKIEFAHTIQEMELILQGLRKLPIEIALELHNRLHASSKAQVDDHLASQPVEVKPEDITVTSQPVA